MRKLIAALILAFAAVIPSRAQIAVFGVGAVPTVTAPVSANPTTYPYVLVSNGSSSTDCTTGGGSTYVPCYWNGLAYTAISTGGGGGIGYPGGSGLPIVSGGSAWGTTVSLGSQYQSLTMTSGSAAGFSAVNLAQSAAVTGTLPAGNGGTGITSLGSGVPTWLGTPTVANLGSALGSQTANCFLGAPNGSSGNVSCRALASADIPNNAANTTGTASNLSGTPALPNGTTATTQSAGDNSTKLATDAFVIANGGAISSVTNSDGSLTISPTTGAVVASLNQAHAFTFTGQITMNNDLPILGASSAHGLLIGEGSSAIAQLNCSSTDGAYNVLFNVTASAQVDPTCALPGVGVNNQTGSTYTLAYSDRASYLYANGGSTFGLTLPAASGNLASNLPFAFYNGDSGNATVTPTTPNNINALTSQTSITILPKWFDLFYQDAGSTINWHDQGGGGIPTFSAFGSTCSNGMTWSTTAGFGCLSAAPILSGGTAGGDLSGTYPNPTVAQIEGAAIPTSASILGTNSSKQLVTATASSVANTWYITGGGTAQAQTATLNPSISSYIAGMVIEWLPLHANTGSGPTLAVNGLSAITIIKVGGASLAANDLTTTAIAMAIYDGTDFELQNPQTSGSSSGTVNNCSVANSTGIYTSSGTTISCTSQAGIMQYAYAAGGGTAQAQTVTLAPALGAWATGVMFGWTPSNANTGSGATINPNSLGVKTITKCGQNALVSGDLSTTAIAWVMYDGTDAELQNPQAVPCQSQQYSNLTGQTGNISTVTLASSPNSGDYKLWYYTDFNSGTGTVYCSFGWTDGSTSRTLTTGTMTPSNGYMNGTMPIFVGSSNVTYSCTANGTVNYDMHAWLERGQ